MIYTLHVLGCLTEMRIIITNVLIRCSRHFTQSKHRYKI